MPALGCSLLALLLLLGASRGDGDFVSSHVQELWNHYQHITHILAFPCQSPQPRVFPVSRLFPPGETRGKAYFPDVTVLHRCDDTAGCCAPQTSCRPAHSDIVNLPFKVTFLEDIERHRKGSWIMEYHPLDNHTECGCTPSIDPRTSFQQ